MQLIQRIARRLRTTPEYIARGRAPTDSLVVTLNTRAIDASIRNWTREDGCEVGLRDLTADERSRLIAELSAEAQRVAGPLALALVSLRCRRR
jgi:hypothetical protein